MPKHEPEVLAAIRRRNPLGDRVVLDDDFVEAAQVLCCPRCDSRYLYCKGSHNAGDDTRILFECKSCGSAAEFELVLTNYKGNVFIEWREPHG